MENLLGRTPPHSLEAEMAVLGSMLTDKETIPFVFSILTEDDFYSEKNKFIFEAIKKVVGEGAIPDLVTVSEELRKQNLFDEISASYITNLTSFVSTVANIEQYAKIVKEKSILRGLIRASTEILDDALNSSDDIAKILDKAQSLIFKLATQGNFKDFVNVNELVEQLVERMEQTYRAKRPIAGIRTGFKTLDEYLAGLHPSQFIIVAGRPTMGKTSFCLNILSDIGMRQKLPVAFFSLEMSKEELMLRLVCSEARVNSHAVRKGLIDKKQFQALATAADLFKNCPIFIDDTGDLSVLDLRLKARRLANELSPEQSLKLIIIDFLQILQPSRKYESKQQEIADISKSLKSLAKELNIPVIAVSQLSRKPEEREKEKKRPQLSDLRESGALEQDADVVLMLYREGVYHPHDPDLRRKAEIIIAKQRYGPAGVIPMIYLDEYTRFEEAERIEE